MYRYCSLLEEATITYAKQIGKHNFSIMAGQTWQEYTVYGIGGSGASILNPTEENWYLNRATEDRTYASDEASRIRRISFLGRAFYNYDSRYMITANFRADASSRFTKNPWGYFPSVAVAWRLSEEPFIKDAEPTWLDNLERRAGFGQVGNDGVNNNDTRNNNLGDDIDRAGDDIRDDVDNMLGGNDNEGRINDNNDTNDTGIDNRDNNKTNGAA